MKTLKELREKSVSQAQQKMMGMALAYKRGEMDDASPEVKKMADSMSMKDLEDFAKTKHKGLPVKKESVELDEWKKDSGWKKSTGQRKDRFGNIVKDKNVAKNLAKSAQKKTAKMDEELDEAPKLKGNNGPFTRQQIEKAAKQAKVDMGAVARMMMALRDM